jgi:hypothetical protein
MLLQSLRALCFAPGGPGSIWNYFGAPVRSTGVTGRVACGFRTDLHFADEILQLVHWVQAVVPHQHPEESCRGTQCAALNPAPHPALLALRRLSAFFDICLPSSLMRKPVPLLDIHC